MYLELSLGLPLSKIQLKNDPRYTIRELGFYGFAVLHFSLSGFREQGLGFQFRLKDLGFEAKVQMQFRVCPKGAMYPLAVYLD